MSESRRLSELRLGESATVSDVDAGDDVGRRILEMGVVPGTLMKMEAVAPLGDPLVYLVRGYRLSLRRSEAARVRIEAAC